MCRPDFSSDYQNFMSDSNIYRTRLRVISNSYEQGVLSTMLRKSRCVPSLCLFCQYGLFQQTAQSSVLIRQQMRSMAQMQRQKQLSRKVLPNRSAISRETPRLNATRRGDQSRGPFGAINTTRPPPGLRPINPDQSVLEPSRQIGSTRDRTRRRNDETFHALKMQKVLSVVTYGLRTAIKEEIKDIDSFDKFDLLPVIKEAIGPQALSGREDISPTPIQRSAIPSLLGQQLGPRKRGKNPSAPDEKQQFLLAAETGSGKTLAYVLPILNAVKQAEVHEETLAAEARAASELRKARDPTYIDPPPLDDRANPTSGRPRAIILLPTSELVNQVSSLLRALSYRVKFRSKGISASDPAHAIRRRVFSPDGIDILVATPHILSAIASADPNVLSRVHHLVIDEADSLMDRSFSRIVQPILDRAAPSLQQLVFCSATIPRSLDNHLRSKYPNLRRLVTPSLHAIPRHVQLSTIDIERFPYQGNRNLACADAIYNIDKLKHEPTANEPPGWNVHRVLVFVNEREKTEEVAEYLRKKGIEAVAFDRDKEAERVKEVYRDFTERPRHDDASHATGGGRDRISGGSVEAAVTRSTGSEDRDDTQQRSRSFALDEKRESVLLSAPKGAPPKRQLRNVKVIVATDLLSRGVDTLAVKYVVLYDVPHTVTDFIHRLGRTGRMKMRGKGIVLVGKHDRRDIVREVREAMFRGQALI